MYCMGCGEILPEGAKQCPSCGRAVPVVEDLANLEQADAADPSVPESIRCPKCDAKNLAENRFCQSCGAEMKKANRLLTHKEQGRASTKEIPIGNVLAEDAKDAFAGKYLALSIIQLVVACLGILPALVVNVPFIGGSYSLFDALRILSSLQSYASSETSSAFGFAILVIIVLICIWLAALILGIVNIVRSVKGGKFLPSGYVLLVTLSCSCLLLSFALNSALSANGGSSLYGASTGELVTASIWVWVMLIPSVIGAVASGFIRELQRKA